jgi:hypothetical protein
LDPKSSEDYIMNEYCRMRLVAPYETPWPLPARRLKCLRCNAKNSGVFELAELQVHIQNRYVTRVVNLPHATVNELLFQAR